MWPLKFYIEYNAYRSRAIFSSFGLLGDIKYYQSGLTPPVENVRPGYDSLAYVEDLFGVGDTLTCDICTILILFVISAIFFFSFYGKRKENEKITYSLLASGSALVVLGIVNLLAQLCVVLVLNYSGNSQTYINQPYVSSTITTIILKDIMWLAIGLAFTIPTYKLYKQYKDENASLPDTDTENATDVEVEDETILSKIDYKKEVKRIILISVSVILFIVSMYALTDYSSDMSELRKEQSATGLDKYINPYGIKWGTKKSEVASKVRYGGSYDESIYGISVEPTDFCVPCDLIYDIPISEVTFRFEDDMLSRMAFEVPKSLIDSGTIYGVDTEKAKEILIERFEESFGTYTVETNKYGYTFYVWVCSTTRAYIVWDGETVMIAFQPAKDGLLDFTA